MLNKKKSSIKIAQFVSLHFQQCVLITETADQWVYRNIKMAVNAAFQFWPFTTDIVLHETLQPKLQRALYSKRGGHDVGKWWRITRASVKCCLSFTWWSMWEGMPSCMKIIFWRHPHCWSCGITKSHIISWYCLSCNRTGLESICSYLFKKKMIQS